MADFFGKRFGKNVWITRHARESILRRNVDADTLERVIEEGEIKRRDEVSLWVFMSMQGRADNLICAAMVEQAAMIVKTVMINRELEDET